MMKNGFAISEYHNVAEIYKKIDALLAQPIRWIQREKMNQYLNYFEQKCYKSKAMTAEAKKFIPEACSTTLLLITHSRWFLQKPKERIYMIWTETNTSIFYKLADPPFLAVIIL